MRDSVKRTFGRLVFQIRLEVIPIGEPPTASEVADWLEDALVDCDTIGDAGVKPLRFSVREYVPAKDPDPPLATLPLAPLPATEDPDDPENRW